MDYYSKSKKWLTVICYLLPVTCYLLSEPVFAYVMKSDTYRIQSDSINIGGRPQSSTNYLSEDTIGEVATSESGSSNYKIKAGYQAMQEVYISLSSPGNINMGNINLSQNTSIGTGNAWNVKTDDPAGYILALKADHSNVLKDGSTNEVFADYTEATSGTPETWSVGSGAYEFGFSVYGDNVSTATWGSDASCGSGSVPSTNLKYMGFKSITAVTAASSSSRTSTSGTNTVFCVAAEQNSIYAPSGNYTADITATATAQ